MSEATRPTRWHWYGLTRVWREFPALSRALAIGAILSGTSWAVLRWLHRDPRPAVFLLGDSAFCNYRLLPQEGLDTLLASHLPGRRVLNLARPGARSLDMAMQFSEGLALVGEPKDVVVSLSPEGLVAAPNRVDSDGESFRYLELDRRSLVLWQRLTEHERSIAVVQRISRLLYTPVDMAHDAWLHLWKWPRKRLQLLHSGPSRKTRIAEHCANRGRVLEQALLPSQRAYDTLPNLLDTRALLEYLQSHGARVTVVIMPFGNRTLIDSTWSPEARARRDTSMARLRHWLADRSQVVVDFNDPGWETQFPAPFWDDIDHMKVAAPYDRIAARIAQELER